MAVRSPVAVLARDAGLAAARQGERLVGPLWVASRYRHWSRLWLGPAAASLVVLFALLARTRSGDAVVRHIAVVEDGLPWPVLLARLPLSMFAPASLLPFWFAVGQVLVVFAAAQAALGARRTVLVSLAGHIVATVSVRMWIWLGVPVGLSRWYLHYPDAGPSAAVLALLAYLAVTRRVVWLAVVLAGYETVESFALHGATQREHLVGVLAGGLIAALEPLARRAALEPLVRRVTLERLARQVRLTASGQVGQPAQMSVTGSRPAASPIPSSPRSASTVRSIR